MDLGATATSDRLAGGSNAASVTVDMRSATTSMRMSSFLRAWRRRSRPVQAVAPSASGAHRSEVAVLYIGGCQRSGSTLLDRMISQSEGHVSAGEIVHLWARGLLDNELCGCGDRFRDCPFWTEVGDVAFGGWAHLDVERTLSLQRRVDRNRYIFFMLWPWLAPRYRRDLARYVAILTRLYSAIHQVGGSVIVDSSKHASTAFLLRAVPSIDLRIVHLVRDSRGVAYSLLKRVRRPEAVDREAFMFRASPWRSGLEWLVFNALFHILDLMGTPTTRVRYEVLVRHPRDTLAQILGRNGRTATTGGDLGFIDGSTVVLDIDHTAAGNPVRFEHGAFLLRVDTAWRSAMLPRDRRVTTWMTWPLLKVYGYLRENADAGPVSASSHGASLRDIPGRDE